MKRSNPRLPPEQHKAMVALLDDICKDEEFVNMMEGILKTHPIVRVDHEGEKV